MEPTKEQFYLRRIAELEKEVAELRRQNAELRAQVAKLAEQVARLSKNSSNSSKPPSSDIVKPPKPNNPNGPRRQGGQPGHHGANRPTFRADQIDRIEELHPAACPCCRDGNLEPTNNAAERSIRAAVIDRRITQGSRSLMGRQWNARIWTVLDTCRKQGRSAWQFLQNALSAYHFQTPAPSLLPQTT